MYLESGFVQPPPNSQVGRQIYQEITARMITETLPNATETLWRPNGHSLPGEERRDRVRINRAEGLEVDLG